ncbi:Response regulator of zinc sigma-54-dependent two-component system [Olavius sp. associated proteobacterium Delta 1]|nr:Response regulator of zinc sigma-54-dependent two-component system [Olavius sp. associated proteobacterium Delta 1]
MRFQSLKSKLLLAVSALVIGSGLLISFLFTQRYSSSLYQSMSVQAENLSHSIELEATDKILTNDLVALQKMLDYQMRSNESISYLFIVKENQILAHSFADGVPLGLIRANKATLNEAFALKKIKSTTGEYYLDTAWPIFAGKAGVLRLGLSETPYSRQVTQLWIQMGAITFGILLLALAVSLLFVKRITRPLSMLAAAAEKIDEDRLEMNVALKEGSDEVGKLTSSFNHMLGRIKDHTRRLEEKNEELDRAHKQTRTSFAIAQEIGALPNLKAVCVYLIKKLQGIVACENMAVLVFSHGRDICFMQSEKESRTLDGDTVSATVDFLKDMDGMQFIRKDQIDPRFAPEAFQSAEQMVTFPMRHENQLLGVMLIACPGSCSCVTNELDIIDLILNQTSGAIQRSVSHEEEIRELKNRIELTAEFSGLIGKDPQMQVIYKLIEDVAPTDATVLIQGESGTGKELVARAIHKQSLRRDKPFVVINCSAYPTTLLESELFGHVKGAFTGAIRQKAGRFEQADGGTVFLDEIGEISSTAQIKLLRILQSQKFERLGGEQTLSVNIRVLAATNKDLLQEVKRTNFREDLFYRLNVIPIQMPPMRNRRNDIPLLARYFLGHFATEQETPAQRFSSEAMRSLLDYSWPGNVRELENSIEHAAVLAKGKYIEISDLPAVILQAETGEPARSNRSIVENERKLLLEVLDECDWNKKAAAHQLGISRSTLYDKLRKYQIAKPTVH